MPLSEAWPVLLNGAHLSPSGTLADQSGEREFLP